MKNLWIDIRKWSFLGLVILFGGLYLAATDNWQIYTDPLGRMADALLGKPPVMGGSSVSGNTVSDNGTGDSNDTVSDNGLGDGAVGENGTGDNTVSGSLDGGTTAKDKKAAGGTVSGNLPETVTGDDTQSPAPITFRSPEEVVYETVEDNYFGDAVFIGDSRTVGMYEYGGLEEISTFYASTGLTIYKIFDTPLVEIPGSKQKQTIEEALTENSFRKIYLMIGINEMGTGTIESFVEAYKETVGRLQELQPDAIIYLQGIMKVTTERSAQGDYITNEGIEARNVELAKLADNVKVYYLDPNPLVCDETGGMVPSYTFDGVHLKAQYIPLWKDYLKSHAVSNEP